MKPKSIQDRLIQFSAPVAETGCVEWTGRRDRTENHADMVAKRRNAAGTRHGCARLDDAAIAYIRSSNKKLRELAMHFGVSESAVSRAKNFMTHKDHGRAS